MPPFSRALFAAKRVDLETRYTYKILFVFEDEATKGSMRSMIIADTHLHLYPNYNLADAIRGCVHKLSALAPDAACVGYMAESSDFHQYKDLASGKRDAFSEGVSVKSVGACLELQCFNTPSLYLCPGRQIVTEERLELLCLCVDAQIPDGLPAETTVNRIREVAGIPVLTWAVGKWLFGRAAVVRSLLETFSPSQLLVGDSAMRPIFWPTPVPMQFARKHGYKVLAGSDPLPADGEESVMGSYASLMDAPFDPENARESLRSALVNPDIIPKSVGARSGAVGFVRRMANAR